MDVSALHSHFRLISHLLPGNGIRKNYFVAACKVLDSGVDIYEVNTDVPFGGIIGIGDSKLEPLFFRFKVMRLHAILHDASGYMRRRYGIGPGYCYILNNFPFNCCMLGHISGLLYCVYIKNFYSKLYNQIEC